MFFFFFFDREVELKPGTVCNVIAGLLNQGKEVVVHKVHDDVAWCYDNVPVRFRTNRAGMKVIEYDPACYLSPFNTRDLEANNEIPQQTDGWGACYRRGR